MYYGRQFIPTNIEDLRAITSASQGGVVSAPTLPERDDFYEVGITHRFPVGVVLKLSGYHKKSSPGTDDTQVPGTAITTDVNIQQIRVTGIEGVVEVRPAGPLSGFLNVALAHAYGYGAVTGGFFTATPPGQPFDLDHDQRLSATVGLTFSAKGLLVTATGIYGSGLNGGLVPNSPNLPNYDSTLPSTGPLGTGLFDFNSAFHVKPSFIVNATRRLHLPRRQRRGAAPVLRRQPLRPEVHAEGRVLRRRPGRQAADVPIPSEPRGLNNPRPGSSNPARTGVRTIRDRWWSSHRDKGASGGTQRAVPRGARRAGGRLHRRTTRP